MTTLQTQNQIHVRNKLKLEALLFDVDGTLADTERDGHRVAFNKAFKELHLDWEWSVSLYGKLLSVTGGKERIRYYLREYHQTFSAPGNLSEFIAAIHARKTEIYTTMLEQGGIPLRPGVRRLLAEARTRGYRLAIATTTTPANVLALLEHALAPGSAAWFEVIAAGDIVPAKKPAPDIYTYALEKLGLAAQQCIAFEDSANGIRSSMDAGLKTIVTVNDYTRHDDFDAAALVLDHLGEPDMPCTVVMGRQFEPRYVDMNVVEKVFHDEF